MAVGRVTLRERWPRYVSVLFPIWFFFAFFTQVKLIPGLAHNIGGFELVGAIVIAIFVLREANQGSLNLHPLAGIVAGLTVLAAISQILLPSSHRIYGLLQLLLLVFLATFLFVSHNLLRRYHVPVAWLLQIVIVSAFAAGVLVVIQGVESGGDIQAAGPFRNRAHMASYMLTAFWLCLVGTLWPGIRPRLRLFGIVAVLLTLYCIAVSGRRSVYFALIVGLVALVAAIAAARKGRRAQWLAIVFVVLGFLYGFYATNPGPTGRGAFFRERIAMIDERIEAFLGRDDNLTGEPTFLSLQRQGVLMAFSVSPILGIGWGGFQDSQYSPTGHEVHSTPLRFLAELGLLGLALYLFFMWTLITRSLRLYARMRDSPYANAYLAQALGIGSMSVSYVYNRHITERTFWVLLAVFFAMEVFAADWHLLRRRFAAQERRQVATALATAGRAQA